MDPVKTLSENKILLDSQPATYKGRPLEEDEALIACGKKPTMVLVDLKDLPLVSRSRWNLSKPTKGGPYAVSRYRSMGHLILGETPSMFWVLDHINGDTLDNRRRNLRMVTRRSNAVNVHRVPVMGKSGYRGVYRHGDKWRVRIGRRFQVMCDNPRDGAMIYDKEMRAEFGPNTLFNFPRPGERSALTGLVVDGPDDTKFSENNSQILGEVSPERYEP